MWKKRLPRAVAALCRLRLPARATPSFQLVCESHQAPSHRHRSLSLFEGCEPQDQEPLPDKHQSVTSDAIAPERSITKCNTLQACYFTLFVLFSIVVVVVIIIICVCVCVVNAIPTCTTSKNPCKSHSLVLERRGCLNGLPARVCALRDYLESDSINSSISFLSFLYCTWYIFSASFKKLRAAHYQIQCSH
ncbi:hypothetical protein TRVL_02040 [Trypanosoma vivax]|nr:hypothetical protein TRVL_02040 [Trypanosoma vivax]